MNPALRAEFDEQGFVHVPALLDRAWLIDLRAHTESLIAEAEAGGPLRENLHTVHDRTGHVRMRKLNSLVDCDPRFGELGTAEALVEIVETLLGEPARRFRDVMVIKPAHTGGTLSWHQDSAYWDVEPKALVSCWISLGDVGADASCLEVVPGSHTRDLEHGIYLRDRYPLPSAIVRGLRGLVSLAGTGDSPDHSGGSRRLWKLKNAVLTGASRRFPVMSDFQDYRVGPDAIEPSQVVPVPVRAGDVIFLHSRLLHASGRNTSSETRMAEIVSFMPESARFVGRGRAHFPPARRVA